MAARENRVRKLWREDKTAVNVWSSIPSAWTAEVIAQTGFDSFTIDLQHGLSDYRSAVAILQAISASSVVPLARVPWNDPMIIMRLLDAGVAGLICPMVNSRAEAEAFVGACRYPPLGYRSYGPIRALNYEEDEYLTYANETIIALAMIETVEALENLHEIVTTPGLDGVYVGRMDLSISMGITRLGNLIEPQLYQAIEKILELTKDHNLVAGIHADDPGNALELSKLGFRLVTPANDTQLLRAAAEQVVHATRMKLNGVS